MTLVPLRSGNAWNAGDSFGFQSLNAVFDSEPANLLRNADFRSARVISATDATFAYWSKTGTVAVPASSERRAVFDAGDALQQSAWGALDNGWRGLRVLFGVVAEWSGSLSARVQITYKASTTLEIEFEETDLPSGATVALLCGVVTIPGDADRLDFKVEGISGAGSMTVHEALLLIGEKPAQRVSGRLEHGVLVLGKADDTGASPTLDYRGGARLVPVYNVEITATAGGTTASASFDLSTLPQGIADAGDLVEAFARVTDFGSEGGRVAGVRTTISGTTVTVHIDSAPTFTWVGSTVKAAVFCVVFPGASTTTARQAYPYA